MVLGDGRLVIDNLNHVDVFFTKKEEEEEVLVIKLVIYLKWMLYSVILLVLVSDGSNFSVIFRPYI